MMRRLAKRVMALLPCCLFAFSLLTSCSESSDEVVEFPDWQNYNTTQWNRVYAQAAERIAAGDPSWKIIKSWNYEDTLHGDNTSYIVVHVTRSGTGTKSPLYTDSVAVNYKGRLLPSTTYTDGYEFDSSWESATADSTTAPALFAVSAQNDGFATALQHMHVGDEWTVYMPWTLGYGTTDHNGIPGYSVLTFDMQLVSVFKPGTTIPPFSAKRQGAVLTE